MLTYNMLEQQQKKMCADLTAMQLAQAEKRIAELEEVLRYYANEKNYWYIEGPDDIHTPSNADKGKRARAVLTNEKPHE